MSESHEQEKSLPGSNRRQFLKNSAGLMASAAAAFSGTEAFVSHTQRLLASESCSFSTPSTPEVLYNGIRLPDVWPPREMNPADYDPMPVPYLTSPPKVIPIDVGRQLFVDDFLIEKTDLRRRFHQPQKYERNPVLKPATEAEMNHGFCPVAAPFSDGVFYDPKDKLFKLWYMAGWFDGTAIATSADGLRWERPKLDVVPGTNLVLTRKDLRRDGASVWLDHEAQDPTERFKMYWWARHGQIGGPLQDDGGYLLTSPDGIHWNWRGKIGQSGDNSTFFYNPFRKQWVFTVRREGRPLAPWSDDKWSGTKRPKGRARSYWENGSFLAALGKWQGFDPVFWLGADRYDHKRSHYPIGTEPQLYKVDAVGYESLMIGLLQVHYGPANSDCAKGGFPKLTELQVAFSRDGFHWDRSNRETFIGATLEKKSWERAYIHSVGGVCNIVGDHLYFYYTAFQGDETKRDRPEQWNGMYANASTGLTILRRDGFASMEAGNEERMLLTRPVVFNGKHLFINADATDGSICVVVCDEEGTPITGFSRVDCLPFRVNSTRKRVVWKKMKDVAALAGRPVRLKFYMRNAKLYAFWVSKEQGGASGGATAAGGPGLTSTWDE